MKQKWVAALLFVCAAVFLISGYFLFTDLYARYKAQKAYDALGLLVLDETDDPFLLNRQVEELKEKNQDTVARIVIENTNIDYPVVQGGDNTYYLHRSFTKEYSAGGCIYLDYRSAKDFSDAQTIIYGHKMITGTMFHDLKQFKKQSFLESRPQITLITAQQTLVYEAVATVITNDAASFITLTETNTAFMQRVYAHALCQTDDTVEDGDRLLILFTCDGNEEDGRELVVCKLMKETCAAQEKQRANAHTM